MKKMFKNKDTAHNKTAMMVNEIMIWIENSTKKHSGTIAGLIWKVAMITKIERVKDITRFLLGFTWSKDKDFLIYTFKRWGRKVATKLFI